MKHYRIKNHRMIESKHWRMGTLRQHSTIHFHSSMFSTYRCSHNDGSSKATAVSSNGTAVSSICTSVGGWHCCSVRHGWRCIGGSWSCIGGSRSCIRHRWGCIGLDRCRIGLGHCHSPGLCHVLLCLVACHWYRLGHHLLYDLPRHLGFHHLRSSLRNHNCGLLWHLPGHLNCHWLHGLLLPRDHCGLWNLPGHLLRHPLHVRLWHHCDHFLHDSV